MDAAELVQLYLDRIERLAPQLNAYRAVFAERALAEASQADGRTKAGETRSLLGVPIAIKDDCDVAGDITAFGWSDRLPAMAS
jgi:amidase